MILGPAELHQIQRVLIVKLGAIGDVVHALPVSAALAQAHPTWELTWLVEERSAPLVTGNPHLADVIVLPRSWFRRPLAPSSWSHFWALKQHLRNRRFDLTIDLQGLSRSALLAWISGARHRYGYDWLREFAPLMVKRIPRLPASVHIVDQLLDVARFFGATVPRVEFPLHIPDEDDRAAVHLLKEVGIEPGSPFLAVNPTDGGYGDKGLGADRLIELLRQLAGEKSPPVVLVGGPEDRQIGLAIQERTNPQPGNLIGRTSLKQLAAVLRRATLHLSGDTGSAHIAAALGTPVISIFGRSNPERLAPYGQQARVIHHRERCHEVCRHRHETAPLNCSQSCQKSPPACLAAVEVAEVADAIRRCLAERARTSVPAAA